MEVAKGACSSLVLLATSEQTLHFFPLWLDDMILHRRSLYDSSRDFQVMCTARCAPGFILKFVSRGDAIPFLQFYEINMSRFQEGLPEQKPRCSL